MWAGVITKSHEVTLDNQDLGQATGANRNKAFILVLCWVIVTQTILFLYCVWVIVTRTISFMYCVWVILTQTIFKYCKMIEVVPHHKLFLAF